MIAYALTLAGLALFMVNTTIGAILFSVGCIASKSFRIAGSEVAVLILFYGAIAGVVVSFL